MNGVKFALLLVLVITGLIILLDTSETPRQWHSIALAAIAFCIGAVVLSVRNKNSNEGERHHPKN